MPIACSTSVVTGADGFVAFKFAGTEFCLVAEDFPAGAGVITCLLYTSDAADEL